MVNLVMYYLNDIYDDDVENIRDGVILIFHAAKVFKFLRLFMFVKNIAIFNLKLSSFSSLS